MLIGSMCSGYGGLDMAVQQVLGGEVAWHAELDPDASKVLEHRYPGVPNLGDITAVRWQDAVRVDIVCAGFPCTDLSYAGRGDGIQEGNRSGLWYPIADALGVLRPRLVVLENVAAIVGRRPGLDVVLADLARLGFDAEWTCVRASDVGGAHQRNRWFLAARHSDRMAGPSPVAGGGRPSALAGPGPEQRTVGPARPPAADTRSDTVGPSAFTIAGIGHPAIAGQHQPPAADAHGGGLPRQQERNSESVGGQADNEPRLDADGRPVDWGRYRPAIQRWEHLTGRAAPAPRVPAPRGGQRLNPAFVEWLMGLHAGWVTAVPHIDYAAQLRLLGNGVVPQQAAAALHDLVVSA